MNSNYIIYGILFSCTTFLVLIIILRNINRLHISYCKDLGYCYYSLYTFPFIINYYMYIVEAEKHFANPKNPTKNELILYQLCGNVDKEDTDKFERIFAKILKGKD